jgi:hypothetical protein
VGEWLAARPGRIYPQEDPRYPLYRRLGGPQSRVDAEGRGKILCLCRGWNPPHPVRGQSLYWLNHSARRDHSSHQIPKPALQSTEIGLYVTDEKRWTARRGRKRRPVRVLYWLHIAWGPGCVIHVQTEQDGRRSPQWAHSVRMTWMWQSRRTFWIVRHWWEVLDCQLLKEAFRRLSHIQESRAR